MKTLAALFTAFARYLLWLLVLLLPFTHFRPVWHVAGFSFTFVQGAALLVIGAALLGRLLAPRGPIRWSIWAPVGLLLALMVLSAWHAPAFQHKTAFPFIRRTALFMSLALAASLALRDARDVARLIRLFVLSVLVVALLGILEYLAWRPALSLLAHFREVSRVGGRVRISSTVIYPTILSQYLEMALPLLLAWVVTTRRPRLKMLLFLATVGLTEAILLTFTRSALLSIAAALACMALLEWRRLGRPSRPLLAALPLAPALLFVTGLFDPVVGLRFTTERDAGWLRAAYLAPRQVTAPVGSVLSLPVRVTNAGALPWEGPAPFSLSYHWFDRQGSLVEFEGIRTPLPIPIAPGESVRVRAAVKIPAHPGEYFLGWDVVQEEVTWLNPDEPHTWTRVVAAGALLGEERSPAPKAEPPAISRQPPPGRLSLWLAALRLWARSPLIGVGPDLFRVQYGQVLGIESADRSIHANNLYLELLADLGLIGVAIFGWLTWQLVLASRDALRASQSPDEWWLAAGLSAALVTTYAHGLLDYFWGFWPTGLLFWLLIGCLARLSGPLAESGHRSD